MSKKSDQPQFTTNDTKSAINAAEQEALRTGIAAPAGDARREQAVRRAAELIEEAEKINSQLEAYGADPDLIQIDREVRQALNDVNEVYVSNAQSDRHYVWVYRDPHNEWGGRSVRAMQARGYQVVRNADPEATEHRHVDGTRVVADCVLMWVAKDRKELLDRRDAAIRAAQQEGCEARIYELAAKAGTEVVPLEKLGFAQDHLQQQSQRQRRVQALGDFHRMNASGKIDNMLRTGRIPGVPVPGAGR